MSNKIKSLVEDLKNLSLIEAKDLVEALEEIFGTFQVGAASASASDSQQASGPVEVQTEFNVTLISYPEAVKFALIKEIRNIMPELGLAEAKQFVEKSGDKLLKSGVSKEDAETVKKKLVNIGIPDSAVKIS